MEKDALIQQLMKRIDKLEQENVLLRYENAELKKRLNKNSKNSSKPPSSDGLSKSPNTPRTSSLRPTGKNKSGGQLGHKGETLKRSETPDKIELHKLSKCPICLSSLASVNSVDVMKRQVFDIMHPKVEVTEHQAEIKMCSCCNKRVTASFPTGVNAPTQYGEVVKSYAIYFQQQYIPEDRLQETFRDLFNIDLATATLNNFSQAAYDDLSEFDADVLSKIKTAAVKHLDETGFRIAGTTQWLHVASTDLLTYYHASAKRKSLLDGLTGIVVHDHWKPYYTLPNVLHGLCNQHHLRELKAVIEFDQEKWARKMQRFLRISLRYRHHYSDKPIPKDKLNRLHQLYDKIIDEGVSYHESLPEYAKKNKRGRTAKRTEHNLILRLKNYRCDVLRFLNNALVPFTNNQAERDLRMMKCKQKISGGFRTGKGADIFIRIRGFVSTARKQGWNVLESIQQVVRGCAPMVA
jgi:transposase